MSDDEMKSYGQPNIPTMWRGAGGETIRSSSPIVHPDDMDPLEREMMTETFKACGECKYFEHTHGQSEMHAQKFVERLVREDNWQVRHLASPLNELGICGAHSSGTGNDEQVLTGTMHKACDQWRPKLGLISLRRKTTD